MPTRKDTTKALDQATQPTATSTTDTVEERVIAFAEQLGRIIGTVRAKADGLLDRGALNEQLTRIRDGASDLLNRLGSSAPSASMAVTPTRNVRTSSRNPSATAKTAPKGTAARSRSGGKVDAQGKAHRKPPASTRGAKHSDEMIPKLKAAEIRRHSRRHG